MPSDTQAAAIARRQRAMSLAARASTAELEALFGGLAPLPAVEDVRAPQTGLVMLQGRMGGDGATFNLGEATVARAAVRLEGGALGFSYVLGRDTGKARAAAILDALVQSDEWRSRVEASLQTLEQRVAEADRLRAARVAATRVDFFTVARGED
jgi:alpha-D-ribose 1-methylphosphonate 5-triphosphate synthase subunit PhnG